MAATNITPPCPIVYSVYALLDPRTETVYYVGQTTDLENRYYAHLSPNKGRKLTPVEKRNAELKAVGIRPELIVLDTIETFHHELALRLEECWRLEMISRDEILANAWKTGRCIDSENPMQEAAYIKQFALVTDSQLAEMHELDMQRAMRMVWG